MALTEKPIWGPQPEILLNAKLNAMVAYTSDRTRFIGAWNAATAIKKNDIVSSGGGKWLALNDSLNSAPVEGVDWTSFSAAPLSGAANLVYATPNGSAGAATLRALVGADLPTATTTVKGAVQFAASGSATAGRAVAADDLRLSDARNPLAHVHDAGDIATGTFDIARLPILPSSRQVVSTGDLTALTTEQKGKIGSGTVVTVVDGRRFVYSGIGDKTLEDSYILLADITPAWGAVEGKPGLFASDDLNTTVQDATNGGVMASLRTVITNLNAKFANYATRTFSNLAAGDKPTARANLEIAGLADVAITGAATITAANLGDSLANLRWHVCSGATSYNVTLPAGVAGKLVAIRVATTATGWITILDASAAVVGRIWAGESVVLGFDGANWFKIARTANPCSASLILTGTAPSISPNTTTLIACNTETFRRGMITDLGAGKIIVPRAGVYNVSANIIIDATNAIPLGAVIIQKNGLSEAQARITTSANGYFGITASRAISCAPNDYLQLYIYQTSAAAVTPNISNFSNWISATEIPSW